MTRQIFAKECVACNGQRQGGSSGRGVEAGGTVPSGGGSRAGGGAGGSSSRVYEYMSGAGGKWCRGGGWRGWQLG